MNSVQHIIDSLKEDLQRSQEMWNQHDNHAKIVGYLEGSIRFAIAKLEVINRPKIEKQR